MNIRQSYDESIEVDGRATYRYGPGLPKPCVHPIVTPTGATLTGFEMSDHVWHRGLWFAIKFVNGDNYWEELAPFGTQCGEGQPTAELHSPTDARVAHRLRWTSPAGDVVIDESRTLDFSAVGDGRAIDWTTTLTARVDLALDRTPFTTWGGYGGLSFRASRELHEIDFLLPDGSATQALTGQRHEWTLMRASVDGGPKRKVSLGIIDHSSNPRGQTPWYNKCAGGFAFMNAAFLFNEPMTIARGEALTFRYRIAYRDGLWSADEFAALANDYRGGAR